MTWDWEIIFVLMFGKSVFRKVSCLVGKGDGESRETLIVFFATNLAPIKILGMFIYHE